MTSYVLYTGDPEFDVLYADGELVLLGNEWDVKAYLLKQLNVIVRDTDSFFLGREARAAHVESKLAVVEAFEKGEPAESAEILRQKAAELVALAEKLESPQA